MAILRVDTPNGTVMAVTPLQPAGGSGAAPFLLLADDGRRYWCKALNNPQGGLVPVTEQLVSRAGQLIGAPVCEPCIVRVPPALAGWEYRQGYTLEESLIHGSHSVEPSVEARGGLDKRASDDNARRHARILALYDWMVGDDPQWLEHGPDSEYHSHDHGFYLPPAGQTWSTATLQAFGTTDHTVPGSVPTGLDAPELERLADALEAVTREELEACASNIPTSWPVSDSDLGAFVDFAIDRCQPVADRLRALTGAV